MAPLLYKIDPSPPSNAVRVLADMIGLELEFKDIDFVQKGHKDPEYMKLNPMGTVPTLMDSDFIITDSHAILKYLLSKYGGDKSESLYPSDLRTRTLVDQCMFFDTGILFIKMKIVVLPSLFEGMSEPPQHILDEIDAAYSVLGPYSGALETFLSRAEGYVAAPHLTLADISLAATAASLQPIHKLDAARFPLTSAWLAKVLRLPSFKKILVPGVEMVSHILHMYWQKNKK